VLVVNKWDLEEETQRQYGPEIQRIMPFMGHCPVVFTSAKTGYNIRKSVDTIDYVSDQAQTDLPTGILNRTIIQACERVQAPSRGGRPLKIYYATQVGKAPVRIRLFVNNPKLVTPNYRRYIERMLREKFGLEGVPISLQFRARKQESDGRPQRGSGQTERDTGKDVSR
jgi:GTP-binding protein